MSHPRRLARLRDRPATGRLVVGVLLVGLAFEATHQILAGEDAPDLPIVDDWLHTGLILAASAMLGALLGSLPLTSWRLGGSWPWVGAGLLCLTVADAVYSVTAAIAVSHEGPYDFLWSAGALLIGIAQIVVSRPRPEPEDPDPVP